MRFNTIGVSDGISMGTDGMCFSLQSRDLIADSIETIMGGQWYDGLVALPGCDKNMPGCVMAMGRLNRPSHHGLRRHHPRRLHSPRQKKSSISSRAFQCYGEFSPARSPKTNARTSSPILPRRRRLRRHVHRQHHGLRHRMPWASRFPTVPRTPAEDPQKLDECVDAGARHQESARTRSQAARHHDPRSFVNAMVLVIVLGGSTNAVLHLIAMARAVDVHLTIDDLQNVSDAPRSWPTSSPAANT